MDQPLTSQALALDSAGMAPEAESAPARFPIVGIGASAGGLAAFSQLLAALPPDSGMAFVLVQHLSPQHESQLAPLLDRDSRLPVIEATEGMAIAPDHVYVIPPNTSMALAKGTLRMIPREPGRGLHLSIDYFLRSLASGQGERAIGVVLSGSGEDGTLGLAEIKAAGGITFVQEPSSAENGAMPAHAIAYGCADFILTPAEIAREIVAVARHDYLRTPAGRDADPFPGDEAGYAAVLALLKRAGDIDLTLYRAPTIKRRILRRMALRGAGSLAAYLDLLAGDPAEVSALAKDVLINVTSFFRDAGAFAAMRELVFPRLVANRVGDAAIRLWVVACSTGQEAYSLAIELIESFDGDAGHPPIQIFATDISEASLRTARTGQYPASIEAEVPPERLRRHFTKSEGGYRVNKSIRDCCVFARHDVTLDTPFSKIDLITCRNVLIYLTPALQMRVIPTFHFTLNPGGCLVLGSSETVGRSSDLFDALDARNRVYVKRPTPAGIRSPLPAPQRRSSPTTAPAPARPPSLADLQRAADRIVLGRYAPAGVLVDEQLSIIQFRGRSSAFLEPAQGEASLSLMKMVPLALGQELGRAIEEAKRDGVTIRRKHVRVRGENGVREVDFEVSLVRLPGSPDIGILILFEDSDRGEAAATPAPRPGQAPEERDVAQLEQELATANDYLQSLAEQNNVVTDELKYANDEAISSNEELRCTNEELQTAKEEVESANEELITLNEELRQRNLELTQLSNDLTNLLDAIDVPILMLGPDRRVRRVTATAEPIFGLGAEDVGRLVAGHDLGFPDQELAQAAEAAMATRAPSQREARDRHGRWCSIRITPYRVEGGGVDGAVMTCIDIDDIKRTQEALLRTGDFAKAIVETVRDPLLVLDAELRVHAANRAFFRLFDLPRDAEKEATLGRPLHRLGDGEWDVPDLGTLLEGILAGGPAMDDFEVTREFARIGWRSMLLNARLLDGVTEGGRMIVLAITDVTGRKRLTDDLRRTTDELRRSNAELDQFAAIASHDLQEPLRMITSYAHLLRRRSGGSLDARAREFMDFIEDGANRMHDLIRAVLDYARVGHEGLRAQSIDARSAADAALKNLEQKILDSGVSVSVGELPTLVADPVLLAQLLQNLVSNAIKFRSRDRQATVAISATDTGDAHVFSVADNGIGIGPADTERIFTLFQRLHSAAEYPGTGIGLATCKKIVERHGGRLWVESALDVGTTFHFALPHEAQRRPSSGVSGRLSVPSPVA